jgi:hypothetical protein
MHPRGDLVKEKARTLFFVRSLRELRLKEGLHGLTEMHTSKKVLLYFKISINLKILGLNLNLCNTFIM